MKKIHYLNTTVYLIVVALYIYEPVLGALAQIALGVFQLVLAIRLSMDINELKTIGRKALKIYWYTILIWFISILFLTLTSFLEKYGLTILYVFPMTIGLYFTVVTFLIKKGLQ